MKWELTIFALLWVGYCTIHSILITDSVKGHIESALEGSFRYYRIIYNTLSILLLIPIYLYGKSIKPTPLFKYGGWMKIVQLLLVTGSASLFYLGARTHDMGEFAGIKQLKDGYRGKGGTLSTSGVLGFVRHPWYLAGIMIIWGRDIDDRALTTNLVLTLYFVIGSYLEEIKLKKKFGQKYLDYMGEVSMLFPLKWLKKKLSGTK